MLKNCSKLGMGAMGSRMAVSLLKAGHEVTVWNRSPGKTDLVEKTGAKVADTPRNAVKEADLAIAMVRDDEASNQVWIKLVVNALFGIQISALGELIGLMGRCGLDEARAVEILASTPVCSSAAKVISKKEYTTFKKVKLMLRN